MCIIFFAYKSHPKYKLILAGNRDEFYDRPTRNAGYWWDYPEILGGRDLEKKGTWLGINKSGEFSAITNYRDFSLLVHDPISRGNLVKDFLTEGQSPKTYMKVLKKNGHQYNPFNLLVGDKSSLYYYSNVEDAIKEIKPGIYGISNSLLDVSWPKVVRGKEIFQDIINSKEKIHPKDFDCLLADKELPKDEELPDTGIGIDWERTLASIFIESPNYGTRASTILMIDNNNHITFMEKSLQNHVTKKWNEVSYEFDIAEKNHE